MSMLHDPLQDRIYNLLLPYLSTPPGHFAPSYNTPPTQIDNGLAHAAAQLSFFVKTYNNYNYNPDVISVVFAPYNGEPSIALTLQGRVILLVRARKESTAAYALIRAALDRSNETIATNIRSTNLPAPTGNAYSSYWVSPNNRFEHDIIVE